jgi:HEAT repeat protein
MFAQVTATAHYSPWRGRRQFLSSLACLCVIPLVPSGYGQPPIPTTQEQLNSKKTQDRVNAACLTDYRKATWAVDLLIAALRDKDSSVRRCATRALGDIGGARAVEALIAALGHTDSYVRYTAAESLGEIRDTRAVEPLIAALTDTSSSVRSIAAKSLGEIRDTRAVEPLIAALRDNAALRDKDPRLRREAAYESGRKKRNPGHRVTDTDSDVLQLSVINALGDIRDRRAVGPLINALNDKLGKVRRRAGRALASLSDDPRAASALLAALRQPDPYVIAGGYLFFISQGLPGSEDALIAARSSKLVMRRW